MPEYKEMYYKLLRASEEAVNLLIAAQQECEEMYLSASEPELKIVKLTECGDEKARGLLWEHEAASPHITSKRQSKK
jgi:hypothetical protein